MDRDRHSESLEGTDTFVFADAGVLSNLAKGTVITIAKEVVVTVGCGAASATIEVLVTNPSGRFSIYIATARPRSRR